MVITMSWNTKYHTHEDFLTWFLTEQEYIDNEFIMIVIFNYGIWLNVEDLMVTRP
jgi:hypothetical protein